MTAPANLVEINAAEARFDVDGEPFPWFISHAGPDLTELSGGLFLVGVEIMPVYASFRSAANCQPIIGDRHGNNREFPWAIHDGGIVYTQRGDEPVTVRLGFLTHHLTSVGVEILSLPRGDSPT